MDNIRVKTEKPYDVLICTEADSLAEYIKHTGFTGKIAIVTDDKVESLYGKDLLSSLKKSGYDAVIHSFLNGEKSKNISTYTGILSTLAENKFDRKDLVIALGGGVVGDTAGFAAATYMRGIGYIQVPTTLLAMVDSSVGGKTAVDLPEGKNLVGAFHQPLFTWCNADYLKTLDLKNYTDGMIEALKCGVIGDRELFYNIENGDSIREIIRKSVKLKAGIVSEDEFENGNRALLNLGHTVGHAIEKLSGYNVSHGEAVGIGMCVAARASYNAGYCSEETADTVVNAVGRIKENINARYYIDEIINAVNNDKKKSGDTIKFIVIREIGKCTVETLTLSRLRDIIAGGLKV